jgi:hypothetical protein
MTRAGGRDPGCAPPSSDLAGAQRIRGRLLPIDGKSIVLRSRQEVLLASSTTLSTSSQVVQPLPQTPTPFYDGGLEE